MLEKQTFEATKEDSFELLIYKMMHYSSNWMFYFLATIAVFLAGIWLMKIPTQHSTNLTSQINAQTNSIMVISFFVIILSIIIGLCLWRAIVNRTFYMTSVKFIHRISSIQGTPVEDSHKEIIVLMRKHRNEPVELLRRFRTFMVLVAGFDLILVTMRIASISSIPSKSQPQDIVNLFVDSGIIIVSTIGSIVLTFFINKSFQKNIAKHSMSIK